MPTLIAKRYKIETEINISSDLCEAFCVTDQASGTDEWFQMYIVRRSKLPDVMQAIIEQRAEQLSRLDHPMMVPLIKYGFDGANNLYYFIYKSSTGIGMRLSKYIATQHKFEWIVRFVTAIADFINDLHNHEIAHGYLRSLDDITLDVREPARPKCFNQVGLCSLVKFVKGEPDTDFGTIAQQDATDFCHLVAKLICEKSNPSTQDIVAAIKMTPTDVQPLLSQIIGQIPEPKLNNFLEIRRALEQIARQLECKHQFFISPTKAVANKAYENGLIPRSETYMVIPFLEQEFRRQVYGWSEESRDGDGRTYILVTSQFVLRCRPDQQKDIPGYFVAIDLVVGEPTRIVFDQERGLPLNCDLAVVPLHEVPKGANIGPLVQMIDAHVESSLRVREKELERKSYLEIWPQLLDEQWRLLNAFSLQYFDLQAIDNESAVVVKLAEPVERQDLPQEEPLRLTNEEGRQSPAGYFEDITGNLLKIGLSGGVDAGRFKKQGVVTIDNAQAESIIRRQRDAIKRLRYLECANRNLPKILANPDQLEIDSPINFDIAFQPTLDDKQREAVRKALGTRDMFLLQGPPGTGKTSVIVETVLQIIQLDPDARILVTSQSNVAVNNALDKIVQRRRDLTEYVVRVGREEKAGVTETLLINRQLEAWRSTVLQKSDTYMASLESKVSGNKDLMEALAILTECEASSKTRREKQDHLQIAQQDLTVIESDYEQLEQTLNRAISMRLEAEAHLARSAPDDKRFMQSLRDFQDEFLRYGTEFLKRADQVSGLSAARTKTLEKISALQSDIQRFCGDIEAGLAVVNDFLIREFNATFNDIAQQRAFLNAKAAAQMEQLTRLGRVKRIVDDWKQRVGRDTQSFSSAYLQRCRVVGATCIGVAAKGEVSELEFDWVIADEAGKALPPELLVPLVRGRKIVLVGDHKQLPPTIDRNLGQVIADQDLEEEEVRHSLFQTLIEQAPEEVKLQLEVQYRMHPAIGKLVGDCFYKRTLKHGVAADERLHGLKWCPKPVIWYNTKSHPHSAEVGQQKSFRNQAEIDIILGLLDKIEATYAQTGQADVSVGIITGYSAQKAELRRMVDSRRGNWPHIGTLLEVDTVDAYQGRERDIVIYSVVRSNARGKIGFLSDERRLNVALSRARELLVIVGNMDVESASARTNPFYDVIQHIRKNPNDCAILETNKI